jgi:hypothetical protein
MVNVMGLGKPTLFERDGWSARTGVPVPGGPMMTPDWIANVRMNIDEFKEYAKAVYAQTDDLIANLPDESWNKEISGPMGKQTAFQMFSTIGLFHISEHAGEIAALKGVQDLKGLPF